jgi:hypothetical protein
MSLASIIADVTMRHEHDGIVDRHAAIQEAVPLVLADQPTVEQIVRQHVSKSIKQHLTRVQESTMRALGSRQISLFDLRPHHVLDGEDGIIKNTRALSRIEFQGLIAMREKLVRDDLTYLAKLKHAAAETSLIWDSRPDWSWGQVEDAYARMRNAA